MNPERSLFSPWVKLTSIGCFLSERLTREPPFTRLEQLGLVFVSHAGILVGGVGIVLIFDLASGWPLGFILGELTILVFASLCVVSIGIPSLSDMARRVAGTDGEETTNGQAAVKEAARKKKREDLAGVVLIGASIVQFAALASLLWETGGPIESPFAEMTLIVAVFTPFIANNPTTIGIVVAASIVFYLVFILVYTGTFPPPETNKEFAEALKASDPSISNPSALSYFAVNVLLLFGGILFTILESLLRNAGGTAISRRASAVGGASTNGEGSSERTLPKDPDDDLDEDATRA